MSRFSWSWAVIYSTINRCFYPLGIFGRCGFIRLIMVFLALNESICSIYLCFLIHKSWGIPSSKKNRGEKGMSIRRIFLISTFTPRQNIDIFRHSQNVCVCVCVCVIYILITLCTHGFPWICFKMGSCLRSTLINFFDPLQMLTTVCMYVFSSI